MPRKLVVAVVGDVSQFVKSLATGARATEGFNAELKELNVETKVVARAQVDAAIKTTQALKEEAAAYTAIAAAAERGSAEQIAASRLAERSQAKLAATMGTTGGAIVRTTRGTHALGRETEHAARGVISGSRAMEGFGRSLAFASGGFLAFEGVTTFLRDSVDAARDAGVAQRSLAAQMKASGESFDQNRERIEKVALSYGKFGFTNEDVVASLTVLERGTGNINKAISLQGLTADIAAAKNLDLSKAAVVVAKVFGGQETALRRAVPGLDKNAHGMDLIRLAQAKLAGQTEANVTSAKKFHAVLYDTEEIVGGALLPVLNRFLDRMANWLDRMNRTGKTQREVTADIRDLTAVLGGVKDVLTPIVRLFRGLGDVVGGTRNEVRLLLGAFLAFKTARLIDSVTATATAVAGIGTNAEKSTAKVTGLRGALLGLPNPVTIAVVISEIIIHTDVYRKIQQKAKDFLGPFGFLADNINNLITDEIDRGEKLARMLGIIGDKADEANRKIRNLQPSAKNFDLQFFDEKPLIPPRISGTVGIVSTTQRNTIFDQMINRLLGDVQDITSPSGRIRQFERIRGLVQQQIARVRDVTRRINLGEVVKQINRDILSEQKGAAADAKQAADDAKQKRQDAINAMLDALAFGVDQASLTATLRDDLAAWKKYQAAVEAQIKIQGRTQELLSRQLDAEKGIADVERQIRDNRKAAAKARREAETAREFRALGLTSEGQERVAGINTLRAFYRQVGKAISDGLIDTNKNVRARLKLIGKALKESNLQPEVRAWINDYLNTIKGGTKQSDAEWTKFRTVNANAFIKLAGLGGLNAAQRRRIQTLFAMAGPGFTLPGASSVAFQAGQTGGVVVHGDVHVHGVQDPAAFEDALLKRAKGRPDRRRGAR